MTDSTATLVFGSTDGETYYLYMAYGAADGGDSASGWDDFEELGDIDSNDNAYSADLPAGWKTSAEAKYLRFFLLRSDRSVATYTDTVIASILNDSVLIVEAGSPVTLSASAEYEEVRLRDTLHLNGGTLTTPIVVVDGEAGCIEMNGGTLPSSARLSLDPALVSQNEYATVLVLRSGKTTLQNATNANANVAARILFNGGSMGGTSFTGKPLCAVNGGKWILEGTSNHPIRFGDLGLQRQDWLTGDGSIETRGPCDVVFDDKNYNAEHDYRGTIWLNTSNTVWNHTGNLVLSNAVDIICTSDNCLPSGPQTGIIEMKWVNRAGPPAPRLNLNGHSVAVRGIDGHSGAVVVTNSSSTVATIRIGEGDATGGITNLVLCKSNINLVKRGSETNFVSLGSSSLAALRVEAGTLVVTGTAADTLSATSVTVAEGATLVIDGASLFTSEISNNGSVEQVNGGVLEAAIGNDGSADTVVWDNPVLPEGTALVKVGSNRAIVQTASALGSDITVRGGTMVFSGRTCTNEWYKFIFNGMQYQAYYQVALGELQVYSDTSKAENVALDIGSGGKVLSANSDPKNLEPGGCVASFATTTTKPSGQSSMNLWDLRNAFDNSVYNAVLSSSTYYLYNDASRVWVAFRMATGKNRVQCYLPMKSYITWYWHPNSWIFQTSPDGIHWTTVDTQKNVLTGDGYGSTPFVIKGFLADKAAGFNPSANVEVTAGATLDARGVLNGQTLSHLTVDMTTRGGTIRGVKIAQGGVLDLVNIPEGMSLHNVEIPITLLDVTNGANLPSWTVLVDGAPAGVGTLKWDGEKLSLWDGVTFFILN
ncbi:MAG: hypothetical protein IKO40_08620 [Kiritimatiellae bacterium]|nr:hypothetical protein [Kiritimatiellia bacterium]